MCKMSCRMHPEPFIHSFDSRGFQGDVALSAARVFLSMFCAWGWVDESRSNDRFFFAIVATLSAAISIQVSYIRIITRINKICIQKRKLIVL
jgi:hypothetical protein